jgi:hypothetical protein
MVRTHLYNYMCMIKNSAAIEQNMSVEELLMFWDMITLGLKHIGISIYCTIQIPLKTGHLWLSDSLVFKQVKLNAELYLKESFWR